MISNKSNTITSSLKKSVYTLVSFDILNALTLYVYVLPDVNDVLVINVSVVRCTLS